MKIFGFDGKAGKYGNFLDVIRKREFIRMEASHQYHQSNRLHLLPDHLLKNAKKPAIISEMAITNS
jgi:hypothetical protein